MEKTSNIITCVCRSGSGSSAGGTNSACVTCSSDGTASSLTSLTNLNKLINCSNVTNEGLQALGLQPHRARRLRISAMRSALLPSYLPCICWPLGSA